MVIGHRLAREPAVIELDKQGAGAVRRAEGRRDRLGRHLDDVVARAAPELHVMWMQYTLQPDVQTQVAEFYGATPSNTKSCPQLNKDLGKAAEIYHCGDDKSCPAIALWKTPREPTVGTAVPICMDYSAWSEKWFGDPVGRVACVELTSAGRRRPSPDPRRRLRHYRPTTPRPTPAGIRRLRRRRPSSDTAKTRRVASTLAARRRGWSSLSVSLRSSVGERVLACRLPDQHRGRDRGGALRHRPPGTGHGVLEEDGTTGSRSTRWSWPRS